jgi:hypothetical protein
MNLVTPKAAAEPKSQKIIGVCHLGLTWMFNKPAAEARGGFVEHVSLTYVAQQSVTKILF